MFSHSRFSTVFLKALIFCVIFGAIGFGISYLYENFLDGASPDGEREGQTVADSSVGQTVDITIEDEDLPAADNTHGFFVGNNRQMLTAEDTTDIESEPVSLEDGKNAPQPVVEPVNTAHSASSTAEHTEQSTLAAAPAEELSHLQSPQAAAAPVNGSESTNGFVPVQLGEGGGAAPVEAVKNNGDVQSPSAAGSEQLGILPDLEEIGTLVPDSVGEETPASDTETDSGSASPAVKKRQQNPAADSNAETMAKAISTLLSREKE